MIFYLSVFVLFGATCILTISWVQTYNLFKKLKVESFRQFATIKVELKQRIQLYGALSKVVSNYNGHESNTQIDTIKERKTTGDGAGDGLINATFENYPDLKSVDVHKNLMGEDSISTIEQRIREIAERYNFTVQRYNTMLNTFPTSIIGHLHNFADLEYFSFEDAKYDTMDVFVE